VPADTEESLGTLDQTMAAQVATLHAQTGLPVGIVAVSEGTLIAKTYLADTAGAPVDELVSVSPLIDPGRVYYPAGQVGWGLASGWGLRLLTDSLPAVSSIHVSPTTALFRSITSEGPNLRSVLDRPLPGIRQTTILPLADAVASPDDVRVPGASIVVAAFHSGAMTDAGIRALVSDSLAGRRSAARPWNTTETIVRRASSAWQVPTLLTSVNPAWSNGQRAR
jgi:alpha-beta hydrolase superfamily lysophospholipase